MKRRKGFGITEHLVEGRVRRHAGAKFALVITTREVRHLAGALEVDILALVPVGEQSIPGSSAKEAHGSHVLFTGRDFLLQGLEEEILISRPGQDFERNQAHSHTHHGVQINRS
jgi:hypothetical protein